MITTMRTAAVSAVATKVGNNHLQISSFTSITFMLCKQFTQQDVMPEQDSNCLMLIFANINFEEKSRQYTRVHKIK